MIARDKGLFDVLVNLLGRAVPLVCLAAMAVPASAADAPPNILFIYADDWGWGDLACHGHPHIKTPNLDRPAREGTDFHQFTVCNPVCSPSRTAIVTGHFPARHDVHEQFASHQQNVARGMSVADKAGTAHDRGGASYLSEAATEHTIRFIRAAKGKPFFVNLWLHETHHLVSATDADKRAYRDTAEPERTYYAAVKRADRSFGTVLETLKELGIEQNTLAGARTGRSRR